MSPRAIGLLWEFPTSFFPFCASVQRHARDTEIDRTAARSRCCGASAARSATLSSTFIIVINRLSLPAGSHERLHAPPRLAELLTFGAEVRAARWVPCANITAQVRAVQMRRDGRGAALQPPSLWDPGQLRFRSHVPRRVPGAKLRRCRGSSSAAASRGVRTNSASSTLRSVRTGLRITAPTSQPQCPPLCIAVRCSLSRRPPSSPSRCSKPDWAEQLLSVQEGTRKA